MSSSIIRDGRCDAGGNNVRPERCALSWGTYGWCKNRNEGQEEGMWVGKGRCQCEPASAAATRTLGGRIDEAADVHPRPRPRKGTDLRSGRRTGLGRCRVRSGGRGWSRAPVGVRNPSEAPLGPAHLLRSIPCLVTREKPVSCWTVQSCERRKQATT